MDSLRTSYSAPFAAAISSQLLADSKMGRHERLVDGKEFKRVPTGH